MKKIAIFVSVVVILLVVALFTTMSIVIHRSTQGKGRFETVQDSTSELEKYVNTQDQSYTYTLLPEYTTRDRDGTYTVFILNMTSQTWLSPNKVSHTVWWHFLTVIVPDEIVYRDVGCIYVTGGDNEDDPRDPLRDPEFRLVSAVSKRTGAVCAIQRQNPNGPIKFYDDPEDAFRKSDDLIGYTFKYFLEDHFTEPEVLLLMPMVKSLLKAQLVYETIYASLNHTQTTLQGAAVILSVVRTMDTVTNFVDSRIQRFFICGASKRGWATWLAAAVDKRVIGIMPLVLDALNMQENFDHHYRSLDGWSWAFKDYWYHNITTYLTDPMNVFLANVVDPFVYREKLTLPKYIVTAGSDEFFLPDDSHYYYDHMLGPTFLRIHPNTDHVLVGKYRKLVDEAVGFIYMVLEESEFPTLKWERTTGGNIASVTVTTNIAPTNITAWSADSYTAKRRDFRVIVARNLNTTQVKPQPTIYRNIGVSRVGTEYIATIEKPTSGWNCFFIEMEFPAPKGAHVVFTTEVHIVPETFPGKSCTGLACKGTLV